jgi:hypothetical protein
MSMTLDGLLSLHGPGVSPGMAEAVEFVARGRGHSRHFFFFGGGGTSAWLVAPVLLVAAVAGFLMRNPDKAQGLMGRFKGAWQAGASALNSDRGPNPYATHEIPPASPSAATGAVRFNSPPTWPIPAGWTPPPDWKPDPSWDPAPPGWRFWLPEPPHAQGPMQRLD